MFSSKANDFTLFHQRNIVLLLFSLLFLRCVGFLMCSELFFGNQVKPLHWCSILLYPNKDSYFFSGSNINWDFCECLKSFSQLTLPDLFTWSTWAKVYNRYTVKEWRLGGCRPVKRNLCSDSKVMTHRESSPRDSGISTGVVWKKTKQWPNHFYLCLYLYLCPYLCLCFYLYLYLTIPLSSLYITINVGTYSNKHTSLNWYTE